MNAAQLWIDRCLSRLRFGQFVHRAAEWFAIYLFILGGAILAARLFYPAAWPHVMWMALAAVPVAWGAWRHGQRDSFSRREATAWLDRQLELGGLLMTLSELPDERWSEHLPQVEQTWQESLPKWSPVRSAKYLSMPILFAISACFVPLREGITAPPESTFGQQTAKQLEEMLKTLEEAQVLKEEEKDQLKEEIQKLSDDVQHNALTHEKWETIDALRDRLQLRLDEASVSVSKASQALGLLSEALRSEKNLLNDEQLAKVEEDLFEMLKKISEQGGFQQGAGKGGTGLGDLQRLIKDGKFRLPSESEARQKSLDELSDLLEEEEEKLSKCRSKCEGCKGGNCRKPGDCEGGNCNRPGSGGVNRGRGDAEMTWGDEADLDGVKFKEMVLPEGFLENPKDKVEGVSLSAPTVEPAESAPRNAAQKIDAATGNESWNRNLSPRHRSVVRKYFQE